MEKTCERILKAIERAESVTVLPHINADGDAIASCQAMKCLLKKMGKDVVIYSEEKPEERLEFISHGIKLYGGSAKKSDLCVVLDCGDMGMLGRRKAILEDTETVINIDHHKTNTRFGTENIVMPDAAATGEILAIVFERWGVPMDARIAKYLYAAICSDSGCFAYSNVSPRTFRIAAALTEYDIDHAEIARRLFDCVDLQEEKLKAELLNDIHSYFDGKINVVTLKPELEEKYGIKPGSITGLVDVPRRIRGCEIAASIKRSEDGFRVSLRSNGIADVANVALHFGGGGHTKAAGCTIKADSIETAETVLVNECRMALIRPIGRMG